ncbi:hypothetical protein A11A3_14490 [Alcanivorax hongdengensis A-11-3]|uniref:Capsule assembly protein Wzi n=1 Tax=Alcanivorax hongdengensis A-11-3 TaxID=1177179 RepID=L0W989_9GAMM|nr:capsule assembly Wzi family protein [Alcanivorax hongdengensis]EKF73303.1 hypothetical protein A11A3_14490 [Alcanivorax hongdengensis A-11-3]
MTARHHVEALQSQGCLDGLTLTWPISWAAVMKSYRLAQARLPEPRASQCANAHARYLQNALEQTRSQTRGSMVTIGGANQEPLFNGYGSVPEDRFASEVTVYGMGERWAGQLAVSYVDGDRDTQEIRADDTYLAGVVGNWQLGVGAIDRWWGPGWQSSLALSNNARPVPGLWLSRQIPYAPETPWLHWIGPWDLQLFAGQLEQNRAIPDAKLLGARFVFRPLRSLQIGLTRLAQWGGKGRPQDASAFWHALIGRDNGETSGLKPGQDPSNQIAGFDFRYSMTPAGLPLGLYGQAMGEDEANGLPSKFSTLAGLDLVTAFGAGSQRYFVEATDAVAGSLSGNKRFNTAYEHSTYQSGFRYYGRNMATSWEGDGRAITLGVQQFFRNGVTVAANLSHATLNQDGKKRAVVVNDGAEILQAATEQDVDLAQLRLEHDLLGGRLAWVATVTDEPVVTFFDKRERYTVGAQWTRNINW